MARGGDETQNCKRNFDLRPPDSGVVAYANGCPIQGAVLDQAQQRAFDRLSGLDDGVMMFWYQVVNPGG